MFLLISIAFVHAIPEQSGMDYGLADNLPGKAHDQVYILFLFWGVTSQIDFVPYFSYISVLNRITRYETD